MDSGKVIGSLAPRSSGPPCVTVDRVLDVVAPATSSTPSLASGSRKLLSRDPATCSTISDISCKLIPKDALVSHPNSSASCKPLERDVFSCSHVDGPDGLAILEGGIDLDEDPPVSSSIPILPSASCLPHGISSDPVLDRVSEKEKICAARLISNLPSLSSSTCGLAVPVDGAGDSVLECSSAISMPMLCSISPVHSSRRGISAGPFSALHVTPGVPAVPVMAQMPAATNFKISESNFPPLASSPKAPPVTSCSSLPQPVTGLLGDSTDDKRKPQPSWASLVKDAPACMHLKFIKPDSYATEGRLKIKLPPSVALKGADVWKNTLVGFFLDKLPFSLIQTTALRLWGQFGLTDVLGNGNGFFFFKFSDPGRINDVLHGGPWYFGGRPIFLKSWTPGMNLSI